MFGIGMPEMLLILAIALIVIGPKKLPDLAKSLGKAMGEFKKATRELKDSFEISEEIDGMKKSFDRLVLIKNNDPFCIVYCLVNTCIIFAIIKFLVQSCIIYII